MRTVIGLIILAGLIVAGAWWLQHLVGVVTVTVGATAFRAPLSVAILCVIVFAVALYGIYRVLDVLLGIGNLVRRRGERGSRKRGEQAITNVLVALAAREGGDAKREAAKARRLLGDTPQTLLLSAYAGSIAGDEETATEAFEKLASRKDSAFLGYRGLLGQAVAKEDWAQANELAKKAEQSHPSAAWVRTERTGLAVRTGDWQEALLLNRDAAPHAALAAAAADAETDPAKAHKLAKAAFKRDPGLAAAALAYARRLREGGREKAAQEVLRQAWARAPQPDIATLALAPAVDRPARLKAAEQLVKDAPQSGESQLLLGRLALEAGLTDDAKRHAEAAERAGLKQRRTYMLIADIAEAAGDEQAYRDALRMASSAEQDPVWRCDACGATHEAWSPACPVCHAAGTLRWGTAKQSVSGLLAT